MTAIVSNYKNYLYAREYSNDAPPPSHLAKRVAFAAVPFLSLHTGLRFPVSLTMGSLRVWNSDRKNIPGTTLAIIALVSNIFQHQVGMFMTTVHDILIEINHVRKAKNKEEAYKSLIKIFNQLVYLALISRGGLELCILSCGLQAVLNLIQSREDFQRGRWIEGVANLLMTGVRLHQYHTKWQQLKRNWEIEAAIKRITVGELHEKWQFPSDHLPVGVEVNGVRIISWNVLNNAFMKWVTEIDTQGLNGSMISTLDKAVTKDGLTIRDLLVADMVQDMMKQGHVVALQECGDPFLQHLQTRIPNNWELVKSFDSKKVDQDVILFNKSQLTYQANLSETSHSAYPSVPDRPLQNSYFKREDGQNIRIINAHVPGDPALPGRNEFATYIKQQHNQHTITVAVGDNNFDRNEMIDAYRKAGLTETDFSLHTPWKSNIDPNTKQSKGIDHVMVLGEHYSRDLKPEEVLTNSKILENTISLLNTEQKTI